MWLFSSRVAFLDDFSQQRCCINVEQTFDFRINCVGRIVSGCPNDPDVGVYLAAASRSSGSTRISTTRASSFAQRWGLRWRRRCRRGPWRSQWCWAACHWVCGGNSEAEVVAVASDCADLTSESLTWCCCCYCFCPQNRCCCCCCWGCCCCCGTGRRCIHRRCRSSPPCRDPCSRAPAVTCWEAGAESLCRRCEHRESWLVTELGPVRVLRLGHCLGRSPHSPLSLPSLWLSGPWHISRNIGYMATWRGRTLRGEHFLWIMHLCQIYTMYI